MSATDVNNEEGVTSTPTSQETDSKAQPYIEGDTANNIARGLTIRAEQKQAAQVDASSVKPEDTATSDESSPTEVVEDTPASDDVVENSEDTTDDASEDATPESSDDEPVATSDDASDDTEKEEDDAWFYVGEDTQYRTATDAIEGIEATQLYVGELESKVAANDERVTELEAVNAFYQQVLDQDSMKAKAVQNYLPDEFKGKSEDDFEDDGDTRRFVRAVIQAEEQFDAALRRSQDAAKEEQKEQAKLATAARTWVNANVNARFFEAKNPAQLKEANDKLKVVLTEDGDDQLTARQVGQLIHEMFGEKASDFFFRGIREDLLGATVREAPATTDTKPVQKDHSKETKKTPAEVIAQQAEDKKKKVVQTVKETKVVQSPISSPTPADDTVTPKTTRERISSGLAAALNRK
jgi:hypothetical protein